MTPLEDAHGNSQKADLGAFQLLLCLFVGGQLVHFLLGNRLTNVVELPAFCLMWTPFRITSLAVTILSVVVDSSTFQNGTECTISVCKINDQSLRFFHLGDWGGGDSPPFVTPAQATVAKTMNRMGVDRRVHFTLSVGDHFYTNGVWYANDSRFRTTFDDVFTFGKASHIPWYMTAGNHDYYASVDAQMEYAYTNPRWIYPNLSYVVHYELTPSATTIDFVLVDTVILCGGTWYGGVNPKTGQYENSFDLPKGPEDPAKAKALWSWAEEQLSKSKSDYLFVVGHYPIFSAGYHGDFTCPGVRLLTLLERYNVTAYMFGHDHNLQYLKSTSTQGWVVHHILSGGGNSLDKRTRTLQPPSGVNITSLFFYPKPEQHHQPNTHNVGGFVYAELEPKTGSFWFYSGDGKKLYHVDVQPRWTSHVSNKPMQLYYNYTGIAMDSISKAALFSIALFIIWLIGLVLIRRSLVRPNRTKETRPEEKVGLLEL